MRRITFTDEELGYLQHIMWHFTDYVSGDDRPDHGLGVLSGYRKLDAVQKSKLSYLAG